MYWEDLKTNRKRFFVKNTTNIEQIVLPKTFKRLVFEELHDKNVHVGYKRAV